MQIVQIYIGFSYFFLLFYLSLCLHQTKKAYIGAFIPAVPDHVQGPNLINHTLWS